jgi:tRNA(Ile)-lysidine synthase
MGLDPAVAAVRLAVRRAPALAGATEDRPVLVACSGGADSLALLAATVFEARRKPWRVIGVTVDHGLQDGSAVHAERVVAQMAALGVDETVSVRVDVTAAGQGPEAAAREARYAVLGEVAERTGAHAVLLGHTLDDQAETVLLGLTRGSGGRSIAGMRDGFGPFWRPLLRITRAQTEAACAAEQIEFWTDPHNEDARFTRSRIRQQVMPVLEHELGPRVSEALARTAEMLREDMEALDDIAETLRGELGDDDGLPVRRMASLAPAVRRRILRAAAVEAGALPGELFRTHVLALDDLVLGARGREAQLPGHVTAYRDPDGDLLRFRRTGGQGVPGPVAG